MVYVGANPLVGHATVALLLGVDYVTGGVALYFFYISQHTKAVDPVVQILALTAPLSFAIQGHNKFGTLDPHHLAEFKG